MKLRAYRESRGLSLAATAVGLGLRSAGYLSRIESGDAPCPLRLALEIEVWSRGQVRALDLVGSADRLLLESAIARGAPQMEAAE